tara:strand:- start:271 stop:585 length:315 start_codon:yes stop_codon:yes gene_type:complete
MKYRIVKGTVKQIGNEYDDIKYRLEKLDIIYVVERLHTRTIRSIWPFIKVKTKEEWVRVSFFGNRSLEEAREEIEECERQRKEDARKKANAPKAPSTVEEVEYE